MAAKILQLLRSRPRCYWPRTLTGARWSREELSGRLTEISGQGATSPFTATAPLIREAQAAGEPCAWVTLSLGAESTFFPPDFAAWGIDLAALAVVFVPSIGAAGRAAARIVRSGAFGLVVLDLGLCPRLPVPLQGRLASLAIHHDAAVVLVTEKPESMPSVGSMVSLRVQAQRERIAENCFRIRFEVLKDKRRGPGWSCEEVVHGPAGLR